jgi:hypothetical protein
MQVPEAVAVSPSKRSRSDYRASDDKVPCRAFNLAGLSDNPDAGLNRERLYLDWLELAGEGAPTYDTLAPLLGRGRFIGADTDPGVVARCKARDLPHAVFHRGRLQSLLVDRPADFERVGVLNYDSLAGWHSDSIIDETAGCVGFAAQQYKRVGEFVLIVNADTRNRSREVVMPRVQRVFAPLLGPLDRQVEEADCFWYRTAGGHSKMLNVRVRVGFE